jgi:RNA polymerase sigma-70 factor (ECF subfamily)
MVAALHPLPASHDRDGHRLDGTEAFEDFFERHRRELFGAMSLVTGNRTEAEEITQDAFLKVWERWERVATLDDPAGYLFRTAMNLFRSRRRRLSVAARKVMGTVPPTDDLAAIEDRDEVVRALRPLPPRQRAAIVLTAYVGLSSEEAARILGIQASTVRALATQARAGLRSDAGGDR